MARSKTSAKARILVVEDEPSLLEGVCDLLAFHGHEPTAASNGEEGVALGLSQSFDLVILDLMLPGINGLDACEQLRQHSSTLPILMLTAKGSEDDVVRGLRCGADDYVTKPFAVRELVARVDALLRRSRVETPSVESFAFGCWTVETQGLRATRDDESVELTQREVALLELFARERGRVVSRRTLLQEVWGFSNPDEIETRTVDVHIGKLRKKIDRAEVSCLETVRGAGYRLSEHGP